MLICMCQRCCWIRTYKCDFVLLTVKMENWDVDTQVLGERGQLWRISMTLKLPMLMGKLSACLESLMVRFSLIISCLGEILNYGIYGITMWWHCNKVSNMATIEDSKCHMEVSFQLVIYMHVTDGKRHAISNSSYHVNLDRYKYGNCDPSAGCLYMEIS